MRSAWLGLLIGGCCLAGGGAGGAPVPPVPPSPSPTLPCPPIETAILGTWAREGYVEEYRPGGIYVINGHEGTVRWLGEGRAFLEVLPELHHEYTLALADIDTLVASDPNRIGTFYRRVTAAPVIDRGCFDIRDEIIGTWAGGSFSETYAPDGSYRVNDLTGTYRLDGDGLLHIQTGAGPGDYYFALTSPTTAIAMMREQLAPTVTYTRAP